MTDAVGGLAIPDLSRYRGLQLVEAAVRWVDANITRALWTEERLRGAFCNRSPAAILAQGDIHYAAPCPDLSGVTAEVLARNGQPCALVLIPIRRWWKPVKFQCGLEVGIGGQIYTVGYSISSRRIEPGGYRSAKGSRGAAQRFRWQGDTWDVPYLAHFGITDAASFEQVIPGFDWERHLATYRVTYGEKAYQQTIGRNIEKARADDDPYLVPSMGRWQASEAGDLEALGWQPPLDPTRTADWQPISMAGPTLGLIDCRQ